MKRPNPLWLAVAAAMAIGTTFAACSSDDERGTGDAPVGQYEDSAAEIINMPDGYGNVATKCIPYQAGKRLYMPTHGKTDVQPVIVDDPTCGAKLAGR